MAIVMALAATPVQGAVSYSKQCDTTWYYGVNGLDVDQEYDGNDWDLGSNSSQGDRFWQHLDDVNISLEVLMENDHGGRQKTLDFEYTVDVTTKWPDNLQYKIIEGASSTDNEEYQDTVSIAYEADEDRDLYIEVYGVGWESSITLAITVKVFDGPQQIAEEFCYYIWVGAI
jgi:hypothetical protein